MTALQAARYACRASGWTLTHLQLQKILYFACMIYIGEHDGCPLIRGDSFEARKYGPVLPSVYRAVRGFGQGPIMWDVFFAASYPRDGDETQTLSVAVAKLGNVVPTVLVSLVHDEASAWKKLRRDGHHRVLISRRMMMQEYVDRFCTHAACGARGQRYYVP